MNVSIRAAAISLLIAALSACGSTPPSSYYMLSADAHDWPGVDGLKVGVGPITVPDYLKGRGMILGREEHRLQVSEFDRWAEPLESGITRVVILNLASLLDTRQISHFPWRADAVPEYSVRLGVVQLTARTDDAILVASWTVLRPRTGELVEQSLSRHTLPIASDKPEDVADAYSALLLKMSEDVARVIQQDAGNT